RHGAHRGALRELRRPPRPRVPRRFRHPHGRPLLHELALAELQRRRGVSNAYKLGHPRTSSACGWPSFVCLALCLAVARSLCVSRSAEAFLRVRGVVATTARHVINPIAALAVVPFT